MSGLTSFVRRLWPGQVQPRGRVTHSDALDVPMVELGDGDVITLRDLCAGTLITGQPGSGKSSGPAAHLALAMLARGMGGLVLCAKPNEAEKFQGYCEMVGRAAEVIRFAPDAPLARINLLDVELRRSGQGGGYVQSAIGLFEHLTEISARGDRGAGHQDPFWQRSVVEAMTMAAIVLKEAGECLSLVAIDGVLRSLPVRQDGIDQFEDPAWRASSFCFACIDRALEAVMSEGERRNLERAIVYLLEQAPGMPEKTWSSVLATFRGLALPFMLEPFATTFGSDTELHFSDCWERRRILIVDTPLKTYGEVGRLAGALMKYGFMQAVERRVIGPDSPACFLFCDEYQEFIAKSDAAFLATARESRCCSVLVTQNISNLYMRVAAPDPRPIVDSLLGNVTLKLFCSNSDAVTNQWASQLIAQSWQSKSQASLNLGAQTSSGTTTSSELTWEVPPITFYQLRQGGPPAWVVEAIAFAGGRPFHVTGKGYRSVAFGQNLRKE